jgi:integrase
MIKKFYSKRYRTGWKYDTGRKQYFSWGFDIRLSDGRRKREPGFLTQAEVEAALGRIRLAEKDIRYALPAPLEVPTVQELADRHVEQIANTREAVRARRVLNTLCGEVPKDLRVTKLLTPHLQKFAVRRQRDGLRPSSVDRELNIVSAMLHAAPDYFPDLANWSVPKIPRPRRSKRRRERVISAEEITRVLTWLYSPQRYDETESQAAQRRNVGHVFHTAFLTGARKGELCKLRWDHIDWGAMVIQIVGTKTENRSEQTVRYLKIIDTLAEILRERMGESEGVYVFTREGGEVTHYYRILAGACEAVGIAYGREMPGGFVTHDARHTAVTRMLQAGRDLATIGSITGHADKTLILHYGHASTESRDKAMDVLEQFAGREHLGLGLDTMDTNGFIYGRNSRSLVPEVGLEPT